MGTTTTIYAANQEDSQDVLGSTIGNLEPITTGYPSSNDYALAFRVQPSLTQAGERVVVDAATAIIQALNTDGDGAYTAIAGVHDGDCPDLSTTDIAHGYTDIGDSVSPISPSTHAADDTWTTPSIVAAVQAWFERAGYASDDYLGIWWQGGDSAKNEYWDCYRADSPTDATKGPRVALTYHKASKAKWNGVANANIQVNGTGSDNLNPLQ